MERTKKGQIVSYVRAFVIRSFSHETCYTCGQIGLLSSTSTTEACGPPEAAEPFSLVAVSRQGKNVSSLWPSVPERPLSTAGGEWVVKKVLSALNFFRFVEGLR
jgi:hypothetical protein